MSEDRIGGGRRVKKKGEILNLVERRGSRKSFYFLLFTFYFFVYLCMMQKKR